MRKRIWREPAHPRWGGGLPLRYVEEDHMSFWYILLGIHVVLFFVNGYMILKK